MYSYRTHTIIASSILGAVLVIGFLLATSYYFFLAAPARKGEAMRFTVGLKDSQTEVVAGLAQAGLIKNQTAFNLVRNLRGQSDDVITPGAYRLDPTMNSWQIASVLHAGPYMKWVVVPEGLRKEEIAELLVSTLGWTPAQKAQWLTVDTAPSADYREGVYFPDTYLIPLDESTAAVAKRFINRFQQVFAPYATEAQKQNIKWTTVIKIAALVQREAAGVNDMPLIAAVIWNRLEKNMTLGIDATLQYARGDTGAGWWAPITAAQKQINSPYNTYTQKGLPSYPIANPGLQAINAVLHPAPTNCLYYLHDATGVIHCAVTYAEHQQNVDKYLKGQ